MHRTHGLIGEVDSCEPNLLSLTICITITLLLFILKKSSFKLFWLLNYIKNNIKYEKYVNDIHKRNEGLKLQIPTPYDSHRSIKNWTFRYFGSLLRSPFSFDCCKSSQFTLHISDHVLADSTKWKQITFFL